MKKKMKILVLNFLIQDFFQEPKYFRKGGAMNINQTIPRNDCFGVVYSQPQWCVGECYAPVEPIPALVMSLRALYSAPKYKTDIVSIALLIVFEK